MFHSAENRKTVRGEVEMSCDGCLYWKDDRCIHTNRETTYLECERNSVKQEIKQLKEEVEYWKNKAEGCT